MFTIAEVGDLLHIPRLKGGDADEYPVECPYCGDVRGKCSFCIEKDGEVKNVYQCYGCGQTGNMLTLYADLTGLSGTGRYKEAYRQIRSRLSKETPGQRIREKESGHGNSRKPGKETPATIAGEDTRNRVYQAMLPMLKLSEKHKADLKRRGLLDKEISRMEGMGYKSTDAKVSEEIARRLIKQGLSLEGIPGFFINRDGNWEVSFYAGNAGYLCPVYSADGFLCAFQIRIDRPKSKQKYVWLTSAKLFKGCSPGCPVGVSGNPYAKRVYVTEGILKAEITHQVTGRTYLGNPGVANHKNLREVLGLLKARGLKEVLETYDMDKMLDLACREDYDATCGACSLKGAGECPKKRVKRDNIRRGCLKLYQICGELSIPCRRVLWDFKENGLWLENQKGCDDWETERRNQEWEKQAA